MFSRRWQHHFAGKHVLITGASEGVGLALAKMLVFAGANVSLLARTESKLRAAESACLEQLAKPSASQKGSGKAEPEAAPAAAAGSGAPGDEQRRQRRTCVIPADVTDEKQVLAAVAAAEAALGDIDILLACAGAAECGYFHDSEAAVHRRMMELNYMGVVHAARAVLPGMLARRRGHLVAVASTLSLMGLIGYSAYCPSKFAVRGLMESLRNELQGTGVDVSISYPPDMDTPGYARENIGKPPETLEVSDDAVFSPESVAESILRGIARRQWVLPNVRPDVSLLQDITLGLVPRSAWRLAWQMLLALLSPVICWAVAAQHDAAARRGAAKRYAAFWGTAAGEGAGGKAAAAAAAGGKAGGAGQLKAAAEGEGADGSGGREE